MLLIFRERSGLHCLRRSSRSILRPVANCQIDKLFQVSKKLPSDRGTFPLRVRKPLDERDDVGLYPALNLELPQFPSAVPLPPAHHLLFLGRRSCRCRPKLGNRFQIPLDFPFVNLFSDQRFANAAAVDNIRNIQFYGFLEIDFRNRLTVFEACGYVRYERKIVGLKSQRDRDDERFKAKRNTCFFSNTAVGVYFWIERILQFITSVFVSYI